MRAVVAVVTALVVPYDNERRGDDEMSKAGEHLRTTSPIQQQTNTHSCYIIVALVFGVTFAVCSCRDNDGIVEPLPAAAGHTPSSSVSAAHAFHECAHETIPTTTLATNCCELFGKGQCG